MQKYLGLQICIDLQKNCKICRRRDMTTIQKEKSDPEMLFFHSAQWRGYCVFLCITVCSCVLPRVTVCYHVLLCATVCFCVLLYVTVCYCLFLRATLCYCVVLLCVTLCYCVLLRSCVWKSETCEPEKFLLHSNSWSEKFSTEFWWTTTTTKNENNDKMQIFVTMVWVKLHREMWDTGSGRRGKNGAGQKTSEKKLTPTELRSDREEIRYDRSQRPTKVAGTHINISTMEN